MPSPANAQQYDLMRATYWMDFYKQGLAKSLAKNTSAGIERAAKEADEMMGQFDSRFHELGSHD
jgi:hypothetical protein